MASVSPAASRGVDRKLQLKEVLDWLVQDGHIDAPTATRLVASESGKRHPITVVVEARMRSLLPPNGPLTADVVTEWLAKRLNIPFYHIDPLKIDLRSVTQIMSSDYAQRRGILPVEVSGRDVTIATSEPLMTGWEKELGDMLRLTIKRVLANP